MKRYLMFLLVIISSLLLVLACGDSSSDSDSDSDNASTGGGNTSDSGDNTDGNGDGGGDDTTIVADDLSSLVGTYEITYFYSSATTYGISVVISTDCDNNTTYVGADASSCETSVPFKGQVTIEEATAHNGEAGLKIISKMQMNASVLTEMTSLSIPVGTLVQNTGSDYNYTVYTTIPKSAIYNNIINNPDNETSYVTGTTGRNRTALVNAAGSTYQFTRSGDTFINTMTDTSNDLAEASVVVRFEKVSDTVATLDPNEPYDDPEISDFNYNIVFTEDEAGETDLDESENQMEVNQLSQKLNNK